jgi:hypothetical protein
MNHVLIGLFIIIFTFYVIGLIACVILDTIFSKRKLNRKTYSDLDREWRERYK